MYIYIYIDFCTLFSAVKTRPETASHTNSIDFNDYILSFTIDQYHGSVQGARAQNIEVSCHIIIIVIVIIYHTDWKKKKSEAL